MRPSSTWIRSAPSVLMVEPFALMPGVGTAGEVPVGAPVHRHPVALLDEARHLVGEVRHRREELLEVRAQLVGNAQLADGREMVDPAGHPARHRLVEVVASDRVEVPPRDRCRR